MKALTLALAILVLGSLAPLGAAQPAGVTTDTQTIPGQTPIQPVQPTRVDTSQTGLQPVPTVARPVPAVITDTRPTDSIQIRTTDTQGRALVRNVNQVTDIQVTDRSQVRSVSIIPTDRPAVAPLPTAVPAPTAGVTNQVTDRSFTIVTDQATAVTSDRVIDIEIDQKTVVAITDSGRHDVPLLPDTAVDSAVRDVGLERDRVTDITLDVVNDRPVYRIDAARDGRFLGLFDVQWTDRATVDANTADVVVDRPFWTFLVL